MDVIVQPAFEQFTTILPGLEYNVETCKESKERWKSLIDTYQKRTEEGKNYIDFDAHANDKFIVQIGPGISKATTRAVGEHL